MKVILAAQVKSSTVAAAINSLVTVGKDNCTVSLNDIIFIFIFIFVHSIQLHGAIAHRI
jgi:hypothetical protein